MRTHEKEYFRKKLNMKTILIVVLITASIFKSVAQTDCSATSTKSVLGTLHSEVIFYDNENHSNKVTGKMRFYKVTEDHLVAFDSIVLPKDDIISVYLEGNEIYAITIGRGNMLIQFIHFNENFEEISRKEVMSYDDTAQNLEQLTEKAGGIDIQTHWKTGKAFLYVRNRRVRLALIDLESEEITPYAFNIKNSTSYRPSDVLFFGEKEAHVVFEYDDYYTRHAIYYATLSNGKTTGFPLEKVENGTAYFPGAFRFLQTNNKNYLVSLLYEAGLGNRYYGFTLTEIESNHLTDLTLKPFENKPLDNPELWAKKNYKKWKRNGPGNFYADFKIAYFDVRGDQLIIAMKVQQATITMINYIISAVNIADPETPSVNWTVATHNGIRSNRYKSTPDDCALFVHEDHLKFFYNCVSSSIHSNGVVQKRRKEYLSALGPVSTSIAILDIDLKSGASTFQPNPYEKNSAYPDYIATKTGYVEKDTVYLVLESFDNHPLNRVFTPVLAAFPAK